ncbi:MAG: hypothetical protein WBL95_12180 [Microcoleus sp.]
MNRWKFRRNTSRLSLVLASLLTLIIIVMTGVSSYAATPDAAYIHRIEGTGLTIGVGHSRDRTRASEHQQLRMPNQVLYVPGGNKSFAYLGFIFDWVQEHADLLVSAGPSPNPSEWSFPCSARGEFKIAWKKGENRGCEEGVKVQSSSKKGGLPNNNIQASRRLLAQAEDEVTVVPTPGQSIIQTADSAAGINIDVLVGDVRVKSARNPGGRLVKAGERYNYPQDTITPIDINPIVNSPEMQDFLNPNNWRSPDISQRVADGFSEQLGEIRTALGKGSPAIASNSGNNSNSSQPPSDTNSVAVTNASSCSLTGRWIEYIDGKINETASGILEIAQNGNLIHLMNRGSSEDGFISGNRIEFPNVPAFRGKKFSATISSDCDRLDLGLWSDTNWSYTLNRYTVPYCPLTGRWQYTEYKPVDLEPYASLQQRRFAQLTLSKPIEITEDSNGNITIIGLPNTTRPTQTKRYSTSIENISLPLISGSGSLNGSIKVDENRIEGYIFSGEPNSGNSVNKGSYRMTRLVPCPLRG